MKRLGYWLFDAVGALCVLIVLALCVIWVWTSVGNSHALGYNQRTNPSANLFQIGGGGGYLLLVWIHEKNPPQYPSGTFGWHFYTYPRDGAWFQWPLWDTYYQRGATGPHSVSEFHRLQIQVWILLLFFGSASALWLRNLRRRLNPDPGKCRICGYDLRATPERCPECGTIPTK